MLVKIWLYLTKSVITGDVDEVRVQSEEPNLKKPAFEQAFCFSAPVLLPEGEWPPSGDCGFSVNSLPSDLSPAAPHKK